MPATVHVDRSPDAQPTFEPSPEAISRAARRTGYVIAAICNVVMLWLAHQLLDWEWPSFLTPDFDDVLPIISVSLIVGIVTNLILAVRDPRWLKTLSDLVNAVIGFVAVSRTYAVFPFDFSEWGTDWSWLVRTILIIAMIGSAVGAVVSMLRLFSIFVDEPPAKIDECTSTPHPSTPH